MVVGLAWIVKWNFDPWPNLLSDQRYMSPFSVKLFPAIISSVSPLAFILGSVCKLCLEVHVCNSAPKDQAQLTGIFWLDKQLIRVESLKLPSDFLACDEVDRDLFVQ